MQTLNSIPCSLLSRMCWMNKFEGKHLRLRCLLIPSQAFSKCKLTILRKRPFWWCKISKKVCWMQVFPTNWKEHFLNPGYVGALPYVNTAGRSSSNKAERLQTFKGPQTSWALCIECCCLNQTPPDGVSLGKLCFSSSSHPLPLHPDLKQSRPRPWEVTLVTYLSSVDRHKPPTFPHIAFRSLYRAVSVKSWTRFFWQRLCLSLKGIMNRYLMFGNGLMKSLTPAQYFLWLHHMYHLKCWHTCFRNDICLHC